MQIIKYKKICHLRILLIRYWQFFRPGTLVTPFISFAVFYFSLPVFLFYSMKDKFSGIKCMAVHRIYALFALPHQSLMIPVIMEDYTWWLYWSFPLPLLTCISLTFSSSTRSKINQPRSFNFFSQYLEATACSLCIHTTATRTFIQTSSREINGREHFLSFIPLHPCCQFRTRSPRPKCTVCLSEALLWLLFVSTWFALILASPIQNQCSKQPKKYAKYFST